MIADFIFENKYQKIACGHLSPPEDIKEMDIIVEAYLESS